MSTEHPVAILYRMAIDKSICPHGLKSKALLKRQGFKVEDRLLKTREATERFKHEHGVSTTPQAFINDERIGGFAELRAFFGRPIASGDTPTYGPVIAIFAVTAFMALALSWRVIGTVFTISTVEMFIALSMCALGIQKLRDLDGFATQFLGYDLLAQQYVGYARIYPFAETAAGVLMLAGAFAWLSAPIALFIGGVGTVSVFKAVYLDKRSLRCACVGGNSNVPLGAVSLTENVMMSVVGLWLLIKPFVV
ncbi:MAG: glutaredoxin, partial [Pseudomonadota bacterium]